MTSGIYGWTMVVTGAGGRSRGARARQRLADRVLIPNVRYRRDIGDRLVGGDFALVERLGIFGDC